MYFVTTFEPYFIQVTVGWKYKESVCQVLLISYVAWNEDIPAAFNNFQETSENFWSLMKIHHKLVVNQILPKFSIANDIKSNLVLRTRDYMIRDSKPSLFNNTLGKNPHDREINQ